MTITKKPNWTIAIGIPLVIFLGCYLVSLSQKFKLNNGLMSTAILIDLLMVAPVLYLFAIWKSSVPKITVTRIFLAGLLVAGLILNTAPNGLLHSIKTWVAPVIEGMIIVMIGSKFYIANKNARAGNNKIDFLFHCRAVMNTVIRNEKLSTVIASEIAVLYYAFIAGKYKGIDYKSTFTSYRENGITLVLGTILSVFLIETTGIHFLLYRWNSTAAWIVTGLSVYTCMQLYAHIKAIKARPIVIKEHSLEIHNGLAGDAIILFEQIEKIELSKKTPSNKAVIKIALLNGLEGHNIVVYLTHPIEVTKIFGIKKSTDTVMFFVDRPKDFIQHINHQLMNS